MEAQPFPPPLGQGLRQGRGVCRGELRSQTSTGPGGTSGPWPRPEGCGGWGPRRGRLPSHVCRGALYLLEPGTAGLTACRGPPAAARGGDVRADAARPSRASPRPPRRPRAASPARAGRLPADLRRLPPGLAGDHEAPRRELGHLLAGPQAAGASMFVARARQQACDFVADLRAAHARPGLPLSSTFGPCPPTPATTPGAQARSWGTRASTKARRKAFQPAQFPGRIVGGLPAPLCLGSSGHSTRVQPEDPHACKPGGLLTTPQETLQARDAPPARSLEPPARLH